jgi:hypothetical protein
MDSLSSEAFDMQVGEADKDSNDVDAYLAYLRLQDDPLRWEAPRMFNRCAELRRFSRFVLDLEERLDRKLDHAIGGRVDEAAIHGEVFFEGAAIRFSNFGRMIAIIDGERMGSAARRLVAALADRHGYTMIPEALLLQPYNGKNPLVSGKETWGSRFFGVS